VRSFTDSKDMLRAKVKKTGHVTLPTPLLRQFSSVCWDLI